MSGFRDLTAQCGEPTSLSQLANSITQVNPNVLQDSNIYKQIPQAPQSMHPIDLQHRQLHNPQDLVNEFNQLHVRNMPIPQPLVQPMIPQQMPQDLQQQQNPQSMSMIPMNNMQTNMVQPHMGIPSMQYPMMQMPYPSHLMRMQEQYYNQMLFNRPLINQQQNVTNNDNQQQQQQPQKDEIKETGELKDEKTVEDELNDLHPTYNDVNQINKILDEAKDDDKMNNSQFMNFLRTIKEKPPIPDLDEDMWQNEFADWNADAVDKLNWKDYANPTKPADVPYTFVNNNHYLNEKQTENIDTKENETTNTTVNNNNNNNNEKDFFAEGIRLMREGNLNEAILAFEACVQKEPKRSEAWRYLGQCHADNESENNAIAAFMKCIELDPYDLDALLHLGVSYTNEIDSFHALHYLRSWISSHPDYHILTEQEQAPEDDMLAGYFGNNSDNFRIVELFNKALEINNKDPDLHIVLGVLHNLTNEFDKAELHFKKALQARPNDPSLWNKLGATQANGQKCSEAVKAYSKALQLKPNYVRALSNLGISFANQGMYRESCQSYLASLAQNPKADTIWDNLTMSLIHLNRGDLVDLSYKKDVSLFRKHFDF